VSGRILAGEGPSGTQDVLRDRQVFELDASPGDLGDKRVSIIRVERSLRIMHIYQRHLELSVVASFSKGRPLDVQMVF
jgi:hypothetical protein